MAKDGKEINMAVAVLAHSPVLLKELNTCSIEVVQIAKTERSIDLKNCHVCREGTGF